jgi:single-stranded-DNA-specific exonuclease
MNTHLKQPLSQWVYPPEKPGFLDEITSGFNLHPIIAQFFISRGFENSKEIHDYLYAKLPDLLDPQIFADMDKAVIRICEALGKQEGILIYGDNDVDGMTATALLTDFLRGIGANVFYYIPNRNALKQTMILDALNYALQTNCTLMITVDCGITAAKEIEEVVKHNVDVIVTDHHEPTAKIPHCIATLNPKLVTNTYPNRDITGVGVAFKLAHALTNHFAATNQPLFKKITLKRYLDLVALGTIADMGSLKGENRVLVRYGLRQIRKTRRMGLIKLFLICDLEPSEITTADIASKVAPRLNSLGRVAEPRKGVELLLVRDPQTAENLAKELDLYNTERQKIEQLVSDDVEKMIQQHPEILDDKAIVISSDKWHSGVIPIVTTRISKQFNRPTVMIAIDGDVGKGSARTIKEFPLLPAFRNSSDHLLNFGGHDFAAGLTINRELIPKFKQDFLTLANTILKDGDMLPKVFIDAHADFSELSFDFMESLALLEPYGNENHPPVFYCDAKQVWPPRPVGKSHLKLYLEHNERMLEGIGFGMAERLGELKRKNLTLRVLFTPTINKFQNKLSIQLLIRDFKVLP